MMRWIRQFALLAGATCAAFFTSDSALVARQSTTEATAYSVVGTPTELGLAGYAKVLCSAVFVTGRDPAEGAKNSAYWMSRLAPVPIGRRRSR